MAKINLTLDHTIVNGETVTFEAPCDCSAVTGLKITYPVESGEETAEFCFRDAHNNDLTGLGNLFAEGAVVKAILRTGTGCAYIQNADTNGYLESRMHQVGDILTTVRNPGDGWLLCNGSLSFDEALGDFLTPKVNSATLSSSASFVRGIPSEVFYANGVYAYSLSPANDTSNAGQVYYSTDLKNWSLKTGIGSSGNYVFELFGYHEGYWIAGFGNLLYYSTNLTSWSSRTVSSFYFGPAAASGINNAAKMKMLKIGDYYYFFGGSSKNSSTAGYPRIVRTTNPVTGTFETVWENTAISTNGARYSMALPYGDKWVVMFTYGTSIQGRLEIFSSDFTTNLGNVAVGNSIRGLCDMFTDGTYYYVTVNSSYSTTLYRTTDPTSSTGWSSFALNGTMSIPNLCGDEILYFMNGTVYRVSSGGSSSVAYTGGSFKNDEYPSYITKVNGAIVAAEIHPSVVGYTLPDLSANDATGQSKSYIKVK